MSPRLNHPRSRRPSVRLGTDPWSLSRYVSHTARIGTLPPGPYCPGSHRSPEWSLEWGPDPCRRFRGSHRRGRGFSSGSVTEKVHRARGSCLRKSKVFPKFEGNVPLRSRHKERSQNPRRCLCDICHQTFPQLRKGRDPESKVLCLVVPTVVGGDVVANLRFPRGLLNIGLGR